MSNIIPIKFKRVAAAFDEAAKWRRPCQSSSGIEYWPESGASLSDLVNSFIEKGDGLDPFYMGTNVAEHNVNEDVGNASDFDFDENDDNDIERKETLCGLLLECKRDNQKGVKQNILQEIEASLKLISENISASSTSRIDLKRNLMSHLRDKGFDAGLCKSRWEKTGRHPAGTYEYMDININKTRYIVEVFMSEELEIVRPTTSYTALLNRIPSILVIDKAQVLKQIIRLMCGAMKESLKSEDMYVAPWRRNGYMQARYFSPYKRTINRESSASTANLAMEGLIKKRSMGGFEGGLPRVSYYCRGDDFGSKGGVKVGLLATQLQGV